MDYDIKHPPLINKMGLVMNMYKKNAKSLSLEFREAITGYLFIAPFLTGFMFIVAVPLLLAIIMSFTDLRYLNLWRQIKFVGLDNFLRMFNDKYAMDSFVKSLEYAAIYIPTVLIVGLVFALLINEKLYFRNTIRTMLFLPYISNIAAIALVWSMLLDPTTGPVNKLLNSIGISSTPMWLMGKISALPTVAVIVIWMGVGFHFVTYLAALQGVSKDLYEAATIDGAGYFGKLFNITLPSIAGSTFFLLVTSIISSFQNFGPIKVLTNGGPGDASKVLAMNIYNEAFLNNQMSYATSQAVFVFAVLIILTRLMLIIMKRWEY